MYSGNRVRQDDMASRVAGPSGSVRPGGVMECVQSAERMGDVRKLIVNSVRPAACRLQPLSMTSPSD